MVHWCLPSLARRALAMTASPRIPTLATVAVLCWHAAVPAAAPAPAFARTPLPFQHPLVGLWRIELPGTACEETYDIRTDGTMAVTSGAEQVESEFAIDLEPSARGFYRWVDRIVRSNGRPDCLGDTSTVGQVATNYVIVHRSGREFLLCEDESLDNCVGPFRRLDEST